MALLRFLQDGNYRRCSRCDVQADVRVIAASNRDFDEMVQDGSFRQDLLYRLAIVIVEPAATARAQQRHPGAHPPFHRPLRAREYGREAPRLDEAGIDAAMRYGWPGNIRELENVVHRQFLLAEDGVLRLDLPVAGRKRAGRRRIPSKAWPAGWRRWI